MKILLLSPHRDDAAFSLGLAIDFWLSVGHVVEVVNCFTRSEYAPFSDANSVHPNDRMSFVTALRAREDENWRSLYRKGLELVDLRMKDAPLRLRCSAGEVCSLAPNPAEKGYTRTREAMSRRHADAFVIPLALGAHVDHRTVRDAALAGISPSAACAFYEDLPYAARPGVLDIEAKMLTDLADASGMQLMPSFAAGLQNTEASVATKRKLALCYDSQIDAETVEQIAQFCRRYDGRERLWVNAAWRRLAWSEQATPVRQYVA